MTKFETAEKKITNYKWILFSILVIYFFVLMQYPVGLAIGHFAFKLDLFHEIQVSHLLIWGAVRVFIILPMIFSLLHAIDADAKSIYLQIGNRNKMLNYAFWGTLIFTILGIYFYSSFLQPTKLTAVSFLYLLPFFFLYAISNAFVEEVFFRGSLITILTEKLPFWISNLIQATLFALIHIINPMSQSVLLFVLLTFILGLFWGYITKNTKSLIPAIVLHIFADLFVAISLF